MASEYSHTFRPLDFEFLWSHLTSESLLERRGLKFRAAELCLKSQALSVGKLEVVGFTDADEWFMVEYSHNLIGLAGGNVYPYSPTITKCLAELHRLTKQEDSH